MWPLCCLHGLVWSPCWSAYCAVCAVALSMGFDVIFAGLRVRFGILQDTLISSAHWSCRWLCLRCSRWSPRMRRRGSTGLSARRLPSPMLGQSWNVRGGNGSARRSRMGGRPHRDHTWPRHRKSWPEQLVHSPIRRCRHPCRRAVLQTNSDHRPLIQHRHPNAVSVVIHCLSWIVVSHVIHRLHLNVVPNVRLVSSYVHEQVWLRGPVPHDHHLTYLYGSTRQPITDDCFVINYTTR